MKYSNEFIHNYLPRILSQVLLFCCILFVMAKQSRPWVTFLSFFFYSRVKLFILYLKAHVRAFALPEPMRASVRKVQCELRAEK